MLGRLIILMTLHALLTRLFQSIQLILHNRCHYCQSVTTHWLMLWPSAHVTRPRPPGHSRVLSWEDAGGGGCQEGWYHHMQHVHSPGTLTTACLYIWARPHPRHPCDVWNVQQCSLPASDWSVFTPRSSDWPMPTPVVTHPCHAPRPVL